MPLQKYNLSLTFLCIHSGTWLYWKTWTKDSGNQTKQDFFISKETDTVLKYVKHRHYQVSLEDCLCPFLWHTLIFLWKTLLQWPYFEPMSLQGLVFLNQWKQLQWDFLTQYQKEKVKLYHLKKRQWHLIILPVNVYKHQLQLNHYTDKLSWQLWTLCSADRKQWKG